MFFLLRAHPGKTMVDWQRRRISLPQTCLVDYLPGPFCEACGGRWLPSKLMAPSGLHSEHYSVGVGLLAPLSGSPTLNDNAPLALQGWLFLSAVLTELGLWMTSRWTVSHNPFLITSSQHHFLFCCFLDITLWYYDFLSYFWALQTGFPSNSKNKTSFDEVFYRPPL